MAPNRFRVAFSFAGEKRDFVAEVARILANRFGEDAILYDKFHEAEFARYDLGIHLPRLYGEQSDLIVPVLCTAYDTKRWTGWEWVHIYGLLTKADGHRVMPSRFEYATPEGLSTTAAFIELDDKTADQFATLILERLALNEGRPKDNYTRQAPPPTPLPHNLPSLQPFFGRQEELRRLADALDPESRTWGALIDGPGGIGKTSLAVRAAYDAPPEHFDRIVFVSLKSRELDDDGVRDLSGFLISGIAELFNELARELGHPVIAKASDAQRPRLLLDALRGTRTLLVLDNLEGLTKPERDTIFTFVKRLPDGCKAILTSRGRIGSGAEELTLERLSESAALETLAKLAESNPSLAKTDETERLKLYHETSGKPLLLRWTAGQIGRGSCLTFSDALTYLRSCPIENDPLEFVFGDLVDNFSEAEVRALCALAYFTLPVKLEHIAELSAFSEADTARALRSLTNRALVVPSEELKTFALVPLVADLLRRKRPDVVTDAGVRLEQRAHALVVENGYKKHDRFPILSAAWPTVSAALPLFLVGPNERLQTVCGAIKDFLDFTGRWDELLALSRDAEGRAVKADDYLRAGWRVHDAGWIHYLRGEATQALTCADRAENHWQHADASAREKALAIRLRGLGHNLQSNHSEAIAAFREAVELARTLGTESELLAACLNALAGAEGRSGELEAAESNYREALRIATAIGHGEMAAGIPANLAQVALDRKDWATAEAVARDALPRAESVGRIEVIAAGCASLAMALARQDRKVEALPYARRAVELLARLRSPELAAARELLAECET